MEKIIELISENKLQKAIKELKTIHKSEQNKLNELIILEARYNELNNQKRQGVLNYEKEEHSLNKIRLALLESIPSKTKILEKSDISFRKKILDELVITIKRVRTGDSYEVVVNPDKRINYLESEIKYQFRIDYDDELEEIIILNMVVEEDSNHPDSYEDKYIQKHIRRLDMKKTFHENEIKNNSVLYVKLEIINGGYMTSP